MANLTNRQGGKPPITSEQRFRFLVALYETSSVSQAAREAGMSRQAAYDLRKSNAGFAQSWELALEHARDLIRDAAFEEGVLGAVVYDKDGRTLVDEQGNPRRKRSETILRALMVGAGMTSERINLVLDDQRQPPIDPAALTPEQKAELDRRLGLAPIEGECEDVTPEDGPDDCSDLI